MHCAPRDESFFICMTPQSLAIYEPPGNRLEVLKGRWNGHHSIRINEQLRVVFRWQSGQAFDVTVLDYH